MGFCNVLALIRLNKEMDWRSQKKKKELRFEIFRCFMYVNQHLGILRIKVVISFLIIFYHTVIYLVFLFFFFKSLLCS